MVFVCHVTDEFLSAFARNDEVFEYIDDEKGEKVEKINDPYRIGLPKKRRIGKNILTQVSSILLLLSSGRIYTGQKSTLLVYS